MTVKNTSGDNYELRPLKVSITKEYDRVGVFTSFDVKMGPMGAVEWPSDMEPEIVGTPKQITEHIREVRAEANARKRRGQEDEWYAAVWVDDVWFLAWTQLMLYEISEVASGQRKAVEIDDHFWVRVD